MQVLSSIAGSNELSTSIESMQSKLCQIDLAACMRCKQNLICCHTLSSSDKELQSRALHPQALLVCTSTRAAKQCIMHLLYSI